MSNPASLRCATRPAAATAFRPGGCLLARIAPLASLAALICGGAVSAQEVARLYPPQPPAGSSYVRVVNPTSTTALVTLGTNTPALPLAANPDQVSTPFRALASGQPVVITVDGKRLPEQRVAPGSIVTFVLGRAGEAPWSVAPLAETANGDDGLKAELRFYNLAQNCTGNLQIADGPKIFDALAAGDMRMRTINPVQAKLVGACGAARSSAHALPQLKAGDHYSLFLVGDSAHPVLLGRMDQVAPYAAH